MQRQLHEMIVVITGASAGIGRTLAEELSQRGARLVLAARRLDRLEQLNTALGGQHLCVQADVSVAENCRHLVAKSVGHFGRIDTLVCNAGYGLIRSMAETSEEEMLQMFRTNFFGTTDCIRAAVPIMVRQEERDGWRGQIMIVSSAAARRGLPFFGPYSATKAAQLSVAEALRVELQPQRIAVTSVHPIGTETDFFTAAERASAVTMPPRRSGELWQSPQKVVRRMIRAIQHPCPEVWPMRTMRFLLAFGSLMPGMLDRMMARERRKFEKK